MTTRISNCCAMTVMPSTTIFSCGFSCSCRATSPPVLLRIAEAVPERAPPASDVLPTRARVTNSCFLTCAFGSEADCQACVAANCQSGFETCAGIVDLDGDGESTVCDCDDGDATVYPGAPATAQGVDNNCDGVLSPEELACLLDLNGDH